MDDRNRNLNKTFDLKDCPDVVKAMWDAHIYATNQASVAADIQSKFAGKYKCVVLDKLRPDLAGLLASEDVYQWRGGGKTHLFFYFLFDKQENRSSSLTCLTRSDSDASSSLWKQLNPMEDPSPGHKVSYSLMPWDSMQ